MLKRQLLSRAAKFTATHGLKENAKDYLSITKNQGSEGLCWAYALTSTIEMNYAVKSGNRLMLDPTMLKNNSVSWWNDQGKKTKKAFSYCLKYGEGGGYNPICAVNYLINSGDTMVQQDGDDSYLQVIGGAILKISTLKNLYDALDYYGVLYSTIFADHLYGPIINEYQDQTQNCNHAVVITAVGTIDGYDGIYVEIMNSWGYSYGHDGLVYVKIANDENDNIHNNMNMLETNIYVNVERNPLKQYADFICALIFGILLFILLIVLIIFIFLYCRMKKRYLSFNEKSITQNLQP